MGSTCYHILTMILAATKVQIFQQSGAKMGVSLRKPPYEWCGLVVTVHRILPHAKPVEMQ